ncbi:MAG: septum formation initiator family protein [Desulfuromonadaceae bacterium]|nr:septum formation initiator family protein [Desulfuromonas sp.]MDY0184788.1 septum formation initiator family protein [Desulfuromonadaceae bacterium]
MSEVHSGVKKQNRKDSTDRTPRRSVVLAVLGLSFLAFSAFGDNGMLKLFEVIEYKSELVADKKEIVRKNERLEAELYALQHDDSYIEQVARGTLSLVREGETVYQFKETQR